MRLLSSVGADVASLVLETVEGLFTERALVRPGEILSRLVVILLASILEQRSHEAHGSGSHGGVVSRRGGLLLLIGRGVRVEQVVKT